MHACVLIRHQPYYRRGAFVAGLKALGYDVGEQPQARPDNVLLCWNRYGRFESAAKAYERAGGRVVIAENGFLGRDWQGGHWYAMARNFHNGGGWTPTEPEHTPKSQQRWTRIGTELQPWRRSGLEIVVLATRNIGPQGVREPHGWSHQIAAALAKRTSRPVRVRQHPGEKACVPLEDDLAGAYAVVTWGSGAALKALLMGIPVFYGFPKWIGASAGTLVTSTTDFEYPMRSDRLSMFRQLAYAMWSVDELQTGEPFKCLLS